MTDYASFHPHPTLISMTQRGRTIHPEGFLKCIPCGIIFFCRDHVRFGETLQGCENPVLAIEVRSLIVDKGIIHRCVYFFRREQSVRDCDVAIRPPCRCRVCRNHVEFACPGDSDILVDVAFGGVGLANGPMGGFMTGGCCVYGDFEGRGMERGSLFFWSRGGMH